MSLDKKVILLSGKKGSGKDTSAGFIQSYLESKGKTVLTLALADSLKYVCLDLHRFFYGSDLTIDSFYNSKDTQFDALCSGGPTTLRNIMQTVGTDIIRKHLGDDVFVDAVKNRILNTAYDFYIVTDCRFDNEINKLKGDYSAVIEIVRNSIQSIDNHVSEQGVSETLVDFRIINNGTLDHLKQSVCGIIDIIDVLSTH